MFFTYSIIILVVLFLFLAAHHIICIITPSSFSSYLNLTTILRRHAWGGMLDLDCLLPTIYNYLLYTTQPNTTTHHHHYPSSISAYYHTRYSVPPQKPCLHRSDTTSTINADYAHNFRHYYDDVETS